jgi:LysR family tcuABC transcriptional regulator
VESLSGHLAGMLQARQVDLAVLFETSTPLRCSVLPLLDEKLFAIAATGQDLWPPGDTVAMAQLVGVPLILPSAPHGLRGTLDAAFAQLQTQPHVIAEIDGLALLMDAVRCGAGATIQPGAAIARLAGKGLRHSQITDAHVGRRNLLVSLSDDELAPAGLATRVVMADTMRALVQAGRWAGARLLEN